MKELDAEAPKLKQPADVETIVVSLFKAFPAAKYIALNPGLKTANQAVWQDHWYFIGFESQPVYKNLDGAPAWVADSSIKFSEDEWGLFFLHVSSKDLRFRNEKIQTSRYDWASPRLFCWQKLPDGMVQQVTTDELDEPEQSDEQLKAIREALTKGIFEPVKNMMDRF